MMNLNFIRLMLVLLIFSNIILSLSCFSQENNDTDSESIIRTLDAENDSDITMKIYMSSDQSSDLSKNDSNIDSSVDEDIVTKDQVIGRETNNFDKKLNRKANESVYIPPNEFAIPWVILSILILFLSIIFKLIKDNKI